MQSVKAKCQGKVDIKHGRVYNVFARRQGAPLTLMAGILFVHTLYHPGRDMMENRRKTQIKGHAEDYYSEQYPPDIEENAQQIWDNLDT